MPTITAHPAAFIRRANPNLGLRRHNNGCAALTRLLLADLPNRSSGVFYKLDAKSGTRGIVLRQAAASAAKSL